MGRIRTIKPEFPQSESIGRLSRDARLCFIQLWTLADDSGRLRGASRMLASLLYPYDDDAPRLIPTWLAELEQVGCIERYTIEGDTYIQIAKWLSHQKIDRPSESKIPAKSEASRAFVEPSRGNMLDQGRDQGEEGIKDSRRGADAPPKMSADEIIFSYGVPLLVNASSTDKAARSFLGGLRKAHGDEAVVNALRDCLKAKPLQPLEWLAAALPPKGTAGKQSALEARNAATIARILGETNA